MSDNSVRRSATEAEIDAALQSITDVAPSPELHARVMRRLAAHLRSQTPRLRSQTSDSGQVEVRTRKVGWSFEWRVALAAVGLLAIAASIWFALRPAQGPQVATMRTTPHDVTGPASEPPGREAADRHQPAAPDSNARAGRATPATGQAAAPVPRTARRAGQRLPGAREDAGQPVIAHDLAIPALPPPDPLSASHTIQVVPLPDPAPVTMTPVSIPPIEIPEIEMRPIDEQPGSAVGPARQDPNKNPPGAAVRGPAH